MNRSLWTDDDSAYREGGPYALHHALAGKPVRAKVVLQLGKAGRGQVAAPCGEIVKGAEALALPALLPFASWVGTEQDTAGLERCV